MNSTNKETSCSLFRTPLPSKCNRFAVLETPKTPELNTKYEVVETEDAKDPIKVKLIFDSVDMPSASKSIHLDALKPNSESIPFHSVVNTDPFTDNTRVHGGKMNSSSALSAKLERLRSGDEVKKVHPLSSQRGLCEHLFSTGDSSSQVSVLRKGVVGVTNNSATNSNKTLTSGFGHVQHKHHQEKHAPLSSCRQSSWSKINREVAWTNLKKIVEDRKARQNELSDEEEDSSDSVFPKPAALNEIPQAVLAHQKQNSNQLIVKKPEDAARSVALQYAQPKRTPLAPVSHLPLGSSTKTGLSSVSVGAKQTPDLPHCLPGIQPAQKPNCDVGKQNAEVKAVSSAENNKLCELNLERIVVNNKTYGVIDLLGKGGSSKVYQVLDESSRKLRAIKVVNLGEADHASQLAYRKEVEFLLQLKNCSRVIHMYDYEYKELVKELYIVMEKGDNDLVHILRELANGKEPLAALDIKSYWSQMLKAVKEIHDKGIIHSDLKPANFIMAGGKLKLIDFGIASALHTDMTSVIKDTQVGTVNYMSPESLFSSTSHSGPGIIKLRPKSDVWSLGCILYSLTYGNTPFQSIKNLLAKMQAISNPKFQIPFPPCKDKFLLDVLKKCLERDPTKRPSIQELLDHPYLTVLSGDMESLIEGLKLTCSPNTLQKMSQALHPGKEKMKL